MALLKITDDVVTIDMTNMNPTISVSGNNPLIIIEPPAPGPSATATDNFNAVVVNLGMFAPRINITFTDTGNIACQGSTPTAEDGFGSDPFNQSVIYTTFQRLLYLFQGVKSKKKLYLNHNSNYVYVQISGFRATNVAGQKNIMTFSVDLVLVGAISL